jgi:hypothetical protein
MEKSAEGIVAGETSLAKKNQKPGGLTPVKARTVPEENFFG